MGAQIEENHQHKFTTTQPIQANIEPYYKEDQEKTKATDLRARRRWSAEDS